MVSPPKPGDPAAPDITTPEGRHTPAQEVIDTEQPLKGKEKKRVGFVADPHQDDGGNATSTPGEASDSSPDYFSHRPSAHRTGSPLARSDGPVRRPSVDDTELAQAVAQYFEREQLSRNNPGPSRPRPVLRKSSALATPTEIDPAPHKSEVEAKHRADRLAYDVGTASMPMSRRNSLDSDRGFGDHDDLLGDHAANSRGGHGVRDKFVARPSRNSHALAEELVRNHSHRRNPSGQSLAPSFSGTATPMEYDVEYVPRPEKYRGGVLGTLLRLYGADDKHGAPSVVSSAVSSPGSTPPMSRSTTPRPDILRGRRPHSSSTLAGLMESSFMLAAPGSAKDISEAVSEKVKQEMGRSKKGHRSKKKVDEYRIKIHIADILNRHTFLIKLCKALIAYGAPTHRLEAYMRMSARALGIEGQFLYLPNIMIISFDDSNTHTTEVKIVRANQGLDFGRLRDVHNIYKEVVHDRLGVDEATARLNDITSRKPKLPVWLRILLYGCASATVAPFGFEGRYIDMPICFILGCLVGFLQLHIAASNELYANVSEITAAVATSFLARVFGSIQGGNLFCFSSLAQASIALILPGYMVLCASLELQSHQMISGSVRMVYALIYTLFLGYGFTIGSVIYGYMDDNAVSDIHCKVGDAWYTKRPPQNFYMLFVFAFTLCLCFVNQAKWKQTPVQVFISLAGFCVNNFSARFFKGNGIISSTLGALTIGVLANLYSRLGRYAENFFLDIWELHLEPRIRRLPGLRRPRAAYFNSPYRSATAPVGSTDTVGSARKEAREQDLDPELGTPAPSRANSPARDDDPSRRARARRRVGYGLAAAAMLPAIFVQVPSGLAASGSLLSGVTSADHIVRNETILANGTVIAGNGTLGTAALPTAAGPAGDGGGGAAAVVQLNSSAFTVLFSVIQVAINISVGLSLSALLVYPFGKRRSGLFSF
ncbi:hypothetical protein VTJ83DRAFT_740 [Remersonia thermophila]|uniref:Threonine/serine exporter-like N-terminal domain-containing protein n=1 Tax=Remersonia thermophila TaxID=72144 RepID=A0ABR4DMQ2_9PEZI